MDIVRQVGVAARRRIIAPVLQGTTLTICSLCIMGRGHLKESGVETPAYIAASLRDAWSIAYEVAIQVDVPYVPALRDGGWGAYWMFEVATVHIIYKIFLAGAALCALGVVIAAFTAGAAVAGPMLIACFVCLAIGGRGAPALRSLSFTLWILAAVSAAMVYPSYFLAVGDYELKNLIVPLIQIIMFGMGTSMSLGDFAGVVRMPRAVFIGLACQFTIMPLVGVALARGLGFAPEIAAGIVLIGSAPSGVASNVMAYIARANLALSITLTACSTLLAPLMTPLLMKVLAGQFVPVDFFDMMIGIVKMVIVPIVLGLIVNRLLRGRDRWLHDAMPLLSMSAIAVVLTIIVATGRNDLLTVGPLLFLAAIVHNAAGYTLGYWACRLIGLDEQSCRTISIEVGMQNGGLATGIALQMGKVATVGLAPAIFGPWMNISGSALANWWRSRPVLETVPQTDHPLIAEEKRA
ncbi:MAG: bile acid:sodium symporter family protein [Rhodothermales bacterium]|nr:bile acid:sodium symporter family protein [Rhodothermales bacterium]